MRRLFSILLSVYLCMGRSVPADPPAALDLFLLQADWNETEEQGVRFLLEFCERWRAERPGEATPEATWTPIPPTPSPTETPVWPIPVSLSFENVSLIQAKPKRVILDFALRDESGHAVRAGERALASSMTLYEGDYLIPPFESALNLHPLKNLDFSVVLLLDFTASMAAQAGAIEQMRLSAIRVINELGGNHRVGIMEYHAPMDEDGIRKLLNLTTDHVQAIQAVLDFVPDQNGFSEIWRAMQLSLDLFLVPGYRRDAEVRALILLSDGRDTTGLTPDSAITTAKNRRVPVYCLGFGSDGHVDIEGLQRVADETGGIFYRARDVEELEAEFRRIIWDLGGQYRLQYATSRDPSAPEIPLRLVSSYGIQGGTHETTLKTTQAMQGDTRRGRLSLEGTPLLEGAASIFLRSEFIPRDIHTFRFRIESGKPYTLFMRDQDGWLTRNWNLAYEEGWWRIASPDGSALAFGDFGNLLELAFQNVDIEGFPVQVEMDESIYNSRWFAFEGTLDSPSIEVLVGQPSSTPSFTVTMTPTQTPSPTETFTPTRTPTPLPSYRVLLPGDVPLDFMEIPPGVFQMGSDAPSPWGQGNLQQPVHWVTIGYSFQVAKTELTQAQWLAVMESWPGEPPSVLGGSLPAWNISWQDLRGPSGFLSRLNTLGLGAFRLPSEAEWEYVTRAETRTRFSFGDSDCQATGCLTCDLTQYAWWCGSGTALPRAVGLKSPNPWSLFDLHGNLFEWCEDDHHNSYQGAPDDGTAWVDEPRGSRRIVRGGSWESNANSCTSAARVNFLSDTRNRYIGARLVRVLE